MLLINADDLGYNSVTTDRILSCFHNKRIHATSLMTFMEDSERAAEIAKENDLPVSLHLNLTQAFTANTIPVQLRDQHKLVSNYLTAWKFNQIIYNPFLNKAFDYVFRSQWEEFFRLYGKEPARIDGHHHMHLCMNILVSGLLPKKIKLRRNFTFLPGQKHPFNRFYRFLVDKWLKSQFICDDSFFSITPINRERLLHLLLMSKYSDVEIAVHPGVQNEYEYLMGKEWRKLLSNL